MYVMETKVLKTENYPLQSLLFTPAEKVQNPPLIVYLHGAGERGENIEHLYRHGMPKLIKSGKEIPAIVLCPQCPAQFVWNNIVERLKNLIDLIVEEYQISKDRIAITGSSMGGFGTWEMGLTYANYFSAIAPVAGGGLSWRCAKLKTTPVKAYHGAIDNSVPLCYSTLMVNAVNDKGGNAELVVLDGYGHNDGIEYAYFNTDLVDWLCAQSRTNFDRVKEICEEMF